MILMIFCKGHFRLVSSVAVSIFKRKQRLVFTMNKGFFLLAAFI